MYESTWEASSTGRTPFTTTATVLVSVVLHAAGLVLVSSGLLRATPIREDRLTEHYALRHLELHTPPPRPPKATQPVDADAARPASRTAPSMAQGGGRDAQTLVQPGFRTHASLKIEAPIPSVIIWTPELAAKQHIVAPLPDAPSSIQTAPSMEAPNLELQAVDQPVSSGRLTPLIDMQPAGTTSPVTSPAESAVQMAPATVSRTNEQPTPAAVLSISDLRMQDGSVILPPVNQQHGPNASETAGGAGSSPAPVAAATQPPSLTKAPIEDRAMLAARLNAVHIALPRDGKFGFVAVGGLDNDEYPEAFEMWNGRIAYTAYLHVGLPKSWVLQYAQTRDADAQAAGAVARLEAPWPYDILRPNLGQANAAANALLIHGFLSDSGRLESLAVAFPSQFPGAELLLNALREWQFRPARQLGKAIKVEVLLIIPEDAN